MSSEDPGIDKEEKKAQLLDNKDLSKDEIQKLRKEKKEALKQAKKEQAKKKQQDKKEEEAKQKATKDKAAAKAKLQPKRSLTPKRDRADSSHELPTGLDNVSVTVEEIMDKYHGKLHYEVISLGLKLVAEKINGASFRCLAILKAIIKFIRDFQADPNVRIEVDFTRKIMAISNFLRRCKPFTSGIEHAFHHIIECFNNVLTEVNEEAAENNLSEDEKLEMIKTNIIQDITIFANLRIINANQAIGKEATKQIKEDETILTFGANYTVKCVFLEAIKQKTHFRVIVVGLDAHDIESIQFVEILANEGIDCTFCQMNSLPLVGRKISKVFFGGISMMNNGYLVAKAGTATIACWAKSKMVPVVVCIESFKFSKKAVVHSLVSTELRTNQDGSKSKVNNKYDITPSKLIDMVVCEVGCLPAISVSIIKS